MTPPIVSAQSIELAQHDLYADLIVVLKDAGETPESIVKGIATALGESGACRHPLLTGHDMDLWWHCEYCGKSA